MRIIIVLRTLFKKRIKIRALHKAYVRLLNITKMVLCDFISYVYMQKMLGLFLLNFRYIWIYRNDNKNFIIIHIVFILQRIVILLPYINMSIFSIESVIISNSLKFMVARSSQMPINLPLMILLFYSSIL